MFTTRRMLLGAVCSLAVTSSVVASGSDSPLTQSRAAITDSHSVPSIRNGGAKQHIKHLSAQLPKAEAKIKRADLLEPRYWGGLGLSMDGDAHSPVALASSGRPQGRTPDAVLMQTPSQVREVPLGQVRARMLGEAGGRMGGEPSMQPSMQPSGQPSGPTPGLLPPAGSSLPFVFAGRLIDKTEVTLFLLGNNRPILAKVHDVIDGTYRVDKIGNGDAVLTYLPTNTQQTVVFNSTAIGASVLSSAPERAADANTIDRAVTAQHAIDAGSVNIADQAKSR